MAPYTYYFIFSLTLVLAVIFHIANMLYFKLKKRTLTGNEFKLGSHEYAMSVKLSSRRNLSYAWIVLVVTVLNLAYSMIRTTQAFGEKAPAFFILMSVLVIGIFTGAILWTRYVFGGSNIHEDKRK